MSMTIVDFLLSLGLKSEMHILAHSSFRQLRAAFPDLTMESLIQSLQAIVSKNGSIIMPAFTYCYVKTDGDFEIFDHDYSPAKVGAVSEFFRHMPGVVRTSSPTHSFVLWGKAARAISPDNSPESPLGAGSILEWLTDQANSFILMLGSDFQAFTYGHYLEIQASLPWADVSPWDHLQIEKTGVSKKGGQHLKEIPGCSKGFKNFENHLRRQDLIKLYIFENLKAYFLSVEMLFHEGLRFFKDQPEQLLCPVGQCQPCDYRWQYYLTQIQKELNGR